MKKILVSAVSVLLLLAATPLFAQEESLFQEEPLAQEESPVQEETIIEDVFDVPLFQTEPVQQPEVQVVQRRIENPANTRVLNDLNEQTRSKANSIIAKNKNRTFADALIEQTETLKQDYLAETANVNDGFDDYVSELQAKCDAEIQARMLEEQRLAELESDGVTLNSRGQKRLENDIAGIKAKYQKLIDDHKKGTANPQKQQNLLAKINSSIKALESTKFVQSSISDENLVLYIGEYDGTKDAWPYTVTLYLSDQQVAVYAGNLSYSDISGKQIPAVPAYTDNPKDPKLVEYNKYLDSVEIFDAAFRNDPLFIEAQMSYYVKAKNPSDPSSYTVTVNAVLLKNIITEKIINTYNCSDKFDLNYSPESPVDWTRPASQAVTYSEAAKDTLENPRQPSGNASIRSTLNIFPPISIVINIPDTSRRESIPKQQTIPQDKKEVKKETREEAPSRNDNTVSTSNIENTRATAKLSEMDEGKKSVSALLYCLPGTINFYSTLDGSNSAIALGYNMQFSPCPYLFLGLNLEFGLFEGSLASYNASTGSGSGNSGRSGSKNYYFDDAYWNFCEDGFYLITGQLGSYVNLNRNIRFNYFGEAGICSDEFVAGAGCSFEFYSNTLNIGATVGYTGLMFNSTDFMNKVSFGVEFLF
ncbi:MAG: hypothetical protein IKI90_01395 [Treponema sp.]|nr:hypothetical protein [Treponema sp.]